MVTWSTANVARGGIEEIDRFHTLEDCITSMAETAWEEPSLHYLDFVTNDNTGELAAIAIFGPEMELFITCADGRRLTFSMPDSYREEQ